MRSDNLDLEDKSWIEDLPICNFTGLGDSLKQFYREDGIRREFNKKLDYSLSCKNDDVFLYAIFSGDRGSQVAEFAFSKMTADILYTEQLSKKLDEEIKDLLRQSFNAVEKAYLNNIDNLIAKKATLQYKIPDISQYEISQRYQEILNHLNSINYELSIGASVVLALITNKKIYIANIGSCRALLCKTDANNVLRVIQVTVDFNLNNEEEELRFCQLGLDVNSLKPVLPNTRCIGYYLGKTGYKDCEHFSACTSEPILSDPEIVGSITLDDQCRFLMLLSAGLCQTLTELYSADLNIANKEIVQIVIDQFKSQISLMGVAQSSINRISQLHHDLYMQQVQDKKCLFTQREHMTLLIRNFNYPMPNALNKRERHESMSTVTATCTNVSYASGTESSFNSNTNTSYSSDRVDAVMDDCKIKPYVDFSDYYKNVDIARRNNQLPKNIEFD